ncbi:MAG TPA: hypothetical protein VG166_07525 [Caulobacteraceae bacterium]|jgi:predicted O-methyltransferase YrrM|nr:hypothetical protein [Caulobacteraceae bacterium]
MALKTAGSRICVFTAVDWSSDVEIPRPIGSSPPADSAAHLSGDNPMRTVRLSSLAECVVDAPPAAVLDAPSMMSPNERRFLYGVAAKIYTGRGAIVDAGAFLGASTMSLGMGLRDNPDCAAILAQRPRPIVTYEQAIVRPNLVRTFNKHGIDLPVKSSFEDVLREKIAPVEDMVELKIGDILFETWDAGPIEIIFLDILKTRAIQSHVYREFFPSLKVGSIVIQQDYFMDGAVHIKIIQEYMTEYFDYLGEIHSMAVFSLKKEIPEALLSLDTHSLPVDEQMALLDRAKERTVDIDRKYMIELCKIRALSAFGRGDQASAVWQGASAAYPEQVANTGRRMKKAYDKTMTALAKATAAA